MRYVCSQDMIIFFVMDHYGDPPAHVIKEAFNPVVISIILLSEIMLGATTSGLVNIKSTSLKSTVYNILIPLPRLSEMLPKVVSELEEIRDFNQSWNTQSLCRSSRCSILFPQRSELPQKSISPQRRPFNVTLTGRSPFSVLRKGPCVEKDSELIAEKSRAPDGFK